MTRPHIEKSTHLRKVCYDIRGPVLDAAEELEDSGQSILKLNIGNPAAFGFDAPDEMIQDVILNIRKAQGYTDSKGLFAARKAIMHECQQLNVPGVGIDDIFLGNGVSELIMMAMQALLNPGDEVLIPSPDYPLWTAAVNLASGKAVHYPCDEQANWYPDLEAIRQRITPRTRGIVVINPNNPTGAVYDRQLLEDIVEIARTHNLIVFADEIYSKIIYDDATFIPMGSLCTDVLCVSFNGLSKSYRLPGFRSGWMVLSGSRAHVSGYIEGLNMLASMRLCANVPGMLAVQTALGGTQSIDCLVMPGGRLREQRDLAHERLTAIDGITCVKPRGALYLFPKVDIKRFSISNDEQWILDFLKAHRVLLVQGRAFNWPEHDHFRLVFLPHKQQLMTAISALDQFFRGYHQLA